MRRSYSIAEANVIGTIFLVLAVIVGILPHVFIHKIRFFDVLAAPFKLPGLLLAAWFVFGIVAHEALHGVGFYFFGRVPKGEIRFGVHWKLLTPYATTSAAMKARAYRGATALPGLVTIGLLIVFIGLNLPAGTALASFFLGGAGGDALVLWSLIGVPGDAVVRDSADRVGCEVVEAGAVENRVVEN